MIVRNQLIVLIQLIIVRNQLKQIILSQAQLILQKQLIDLKLVIIQIKFRGDRDVRLVINEHIIKNLKQFVGL